MDVSAIGPYALAMGIGALGWTVFAYAHRKPNPPIVNTLAEWEAEVRERRAKWDADIAAAGVAERKRLESEKALVSPSVGAIHFVSPAERRYPNIIRPAGRIAPTGRGPGPYRADRRDPEPRGDGTDFFTAGLAAGLFSPVDSGSSSVSSGCSVHTSSSHDSGSSFGSFDSSSSSSGSFGCD